MELKLQFPPTPEHAAQHAELMVPAAREVSGVLLDYSPESLLAVDGIIEKFRRDGVPADRIASTLFCFGCYVGEVFVRNAGARWRSTEGARSSSEGHNGRLGEPTYERSGCLTTSAGDEPIPASAGRFRQG